jgi:hypothetical protein
MPTTPPLKGLQFETPAKYRIRVQGHFDDSWSARLGKMVITKAYTENNHPMTILVGNLDDQNALSDVLTALYDLRLPLISVENMDDL